MEHPLNLTSFLPANIQHHYLHVIMLCVAVCIIFFLGLYVRSLRSEIPSKSQNFFEVLVGGLSNLAVDVMGKEGKPYLPIVFGIGLYVAVSNLMGDKADSFKTKGVYIEVNDQVLKLSNTV